MDNNKTMLLTSIKMQIQVSYGSIAAYAKFYGRAPNRVSEILSGRRDCNVDTLLDIFADLGMEMNVIGTNRHLNWELRYWESEADMKECKKGNKG